ADESQRHIHDPAGRDNGHALPHGLVFEGTRVVIFLVPLRSLADHLHIAAKRKPSDLVQSLAATKTTAGDGGSEAQAESLHMHVAPFRHQEVPEFVDENDQPKPHDYFGGHCKHVSAKKPCHPDEENSEERQDYALAEKPVIPAVGRSLAGSAGLKARLAVAVSSPCGWT